MASRLICIIYRFSIVLIYYSLVPRPKNLWLRSVEFRVRYHPKSRDKRRNSSFFEVVRNVPIVLSSTFGQYRWWSVWNQVSPVGRRSRSFYASYCYLKPMQALCLNKAFAKRCDKFKIYKPGKSLRGLVSFCHFSSKTFSQRCFDLSVH